MSTENNERKYGINIISPEPGAELSYKLDEKRQRHLLLHIQSNKPGLGKEMIKAFANKVGPNRPVYTMIFEYYTLEFLKERGDLALCTKLHIPIQIFDQSILDCLKIVRVMSPGINVQRLTITDNGESRTGERDYNLHLFGQTKAVK